jgi:hypothetical protein
MKGLLTLMILLMSFNLLGEELNRCFYDHVKDAITLNKTRKPLYANLTENKSLKISRYLILWERFIGLKAKKYDRKAVQYQKRGIPFMCEDFVDMKETPKFKPKTSEIPIAYFDSKAPNSRKIKIRLKAALIKGYESFKRQTETEIEELDQNLSYDCLLRHLLESLRRSSDLAPRYLLRVDPSKKARLDKTIQKYLKLQIFGISQASFIDRKARSIQAKGIPILCNDVPYVGLSPWH